MNKKEKEITKMAYIAGALDGDGSFSIIRVKSSKEKTPRHYAYIQLSNIVFELPKAIYELFGGILTAIKFKNINHQDQLRWSIRGLNCIPVLENVIEFLTIKKQQAINILEFIKNNPFIRGKELTSYEIAKRELEASKIRAMNDFRIKSNIKFAKRADNNSNDPLVLSYVAGLFDTDGCFYIKKQISNSKDVKTVRFNQRIQLSMTSLDGINFILKNFKLGNFKIKKNKTNMDNFIFDFEINNREDCVEFLNKIIPYLMIKKYRAKKLLEFCNGYKKTKYCKAMVDSDQIAFRNKCYQELCSLNKNGIYKPSLIDLEVLKQDDRGQAYKQPERLNERDQ